MITYAVTQGSPEWLALRMGKPTASEFERIITPKEWKPTKGETRRKYKVEILTELILGRPLDKITVGAMRHGHDWEDKARSAYEMLTGVDVHGVGFCTNDEGTIGASPDGLVGEAGSVEIKCPDRPEIHVGYMLEPVLLKQEYWVQTQGQLYVTGCAWTDLISYFSGLDMVTVRIEPDPKFQSALAAALSEFVDDLQVSIGLAKERGWIVEPRSRVISQDGFITDEDVEAVLNSHRERDGA